MPNQNRNTHSKHPWLLSLGILPFVVLAFYNCPSADDLFLHYEVSKNGIWNYWNYFYTNWSSRYFSVFIILASVSGRFILDHYWLVPFIMFSLFFLSSWFLLQQVNRYMLKDVLSPGIIVAATEIFLLLFLTIAPEVSTAFYWLSGCFTHMLPVVLLFFAGGHYIRNYYSSRRKWNLIVTILFLVPALGCSEIVSLYVSFMLVVHLAWTYRFKREKTWSIAIVLFVALICNYFLFFAPGNKTRMSGLSFHGSMQYAFAAAFLKYVLVFGKILATPFYWICTFSLFLFVTKLDEKPKILFSIKWWVVYFAVIGLVFYFLIYLFIPSGVPERANNPVALLVLISLLVFVFHISCLVNFSFEVNFQKGFEKLSILIFILALIFSPNYLIAISNQAEGPVYKAIYKRRIQSINDAKENGNAKLELKNYLIDREELVKEKLPLPLQRPFLKLVSPYPQTIFFIDDLTHPDLIESFAEYHNIDTIIYESKSYERISRDGSFLFHIK